LAGRLDGSSTTVKNPGNLADLRDEANFSGKLPAGSTGTDKHSAWGRVFALETAGGGVLAFYALSAQLTLAPPPVALLLQPETALSKVGSAGTPPLSRLRCFHPRPVEACRQGARDS
jgi:hypothetical protein